MNEAATLPSLAADGAVALTPWGVITAEGADAAHFLHGQLTQDVEHLDAARARPAGYCSPKGRLSMFVLRAKCKLRDASAELRLLGLTGASARAWLGAAAGAPPWSSVAHAGGRVIRLPDAAGVERWLLALPAADAPPPLPALPLAQWQWLEVASGVPTIVGATVEQFVPQMVNLELVGGVHFQKGCYPGQEVVARSQYRGTLKRRAFLFRADAPAAPGQEVYATDDPSQPAGMVANAASLEGLGHLALVELKLAALDQPLALGAPDGPRLQRVAMPYAVPLEAA
ncbi:MAG: folate-binding protein [Burkholderiaceae bacterium]|nr:folate-binding protein [Burkholderiaceae bacterium]